MMRKILKLFKSFNRFIDRMLYSLTVFLFTGFHFTKDNNMFLLTLSFSMFISFNSLFSATSIKNKIDDLYTYLINKKDFELMLVYNLFDGINYTYFDVNNMNDINSFWIIQSLEYSVFNVESLTFIDDCNYLTLKGNWIVLRSDTDFYRISTIFEKKGYAFFVKNIFLAKAILKILLQD